MSKVSNTSQLTNVNLHLYRPIGMWILSDRTTIHDHISFLTQLLVKMVRENWSFCDVNQHIQQFWCHPYDSDQHIKFANRECLIELCPQTYRLYYRNNKNGKRHHLEYHNTAFSDLFERIIDPRISEIYQRLYREFFDTPPRMDHLVCLHQFICGSSDLNLSDFDQQLREAINMILKNVEKIS